MSDRLSNGTGQANESRSWSAIPMDEASETAGARSVAAHKDAMKLMDTAARTSVGPAGVTERQVGLQSADQTPAGGAEQSVAQVMLRVRSAVNRTFPPKGSFARNRGRGPNRKRFEG